MSSKKGGLDVPFMAIYIPSSYLETGEPKKKLTLLIWLSKLQIKIQTSLKLPIVFQTQTEFSRR